LRGSKPDLGSREVLVIVVAVNEVIGMLRSVVLSMCVLASGVGCSDPSAPSSLSVSASLDRTRARPGDAITVATEALNTGEVAVRLPGKLYAMLEVRDAANRVVFFGRSGTFTMELPPPRVLEPGERVTDRPFWAVVVVGTSTSQAPPGVYRVRAAVSVLGGKKVHYFFSEPMEVTVEAPE
jgi:hypothetical protein